MTIQSRLGQNKDYLLKSYLAGASTTELGEEFACSGASVFVFLRAAGVEMRHGKTVDKNMAAIKELHDQGLSAYAIKQKLGLGKNAAERALKKMGIDISHRQRKRDDPLKDHEAEIISLYESGLGTYLIGKRFRCQDSAIVRFLKKRRVVLRPLRTYPVNESFFDVIDTEEKAYILGFWYADGWNEPRVPVIGMSLTDEDILRTISASLGFDGPIDILSPRGKGKLTQYRIRIGSRKMSDALCRVGCVGNKTYLASFPDETMLPRHLVRHFVRGLNDGDGTITASDVAGCVKMQWISRIVGTQAVCDGLSTAINFHLGFPACVCPVNVGEFHTTYAFSITGSRQLAAYLNWLYADATIFLARKRDKYHEFLAR